MRLALAVFCKSCLSDRFPARYGVALGAHRRQLTEATEEGLGGEVDKTCEFHQFAGPVPLLLSSLPCECTEFLLGVVLLLC